MDSESGTSKPAVLAPAGSRASFLAAVAAGADAIYCGLKQFSARMEARNFALDELAGLVDLAHARGTRVLVALNTLIKPGELDDVGRLLDRLGREVRPDAVIVQDLAMAQLVRQTGFPGKVIWSTLANLTLASALASLQDKLPIDSLVLPRELTIEEIKAMAAACPPGLSLEVFIHGALCYGVSGRCYWSSFLGGKSGLRGRCVQPCRRVYAQGRQGQRFFSCLDLSIDTLVKVLLGIPQIRSWKIEGRKKGPHYVYYVVTGYRLLRDHGRDPQAKKDALHYLSRSLGRPGTHYYFLPQRPQIPIDPKAQTGSGLFLGRVKGAARRLFLSPAIELLPDDLLRVGYEDMPGHRIERIGRAVPKGGRYALNPATGSGSKGAPVFLIDRREKTLDGLIKRLEAELLLQAPPTPRPSSFRAQLPRPARAQARINPTDLRVYRLPPRQAGPGPIGRWLEPETVARTPDALQPRTWWWLPPVVFPGDEEETRALIQAVSSRGAGTFVLNAPWQASLFDRLDRSSLEGVSEPWITPAGKAQADSKAEHTRQYVSISRGLERRPRASDGVMKPLLRLWAGPFCNLTNPLALETAAGLGFAGAIVAPELGAADFLKLPGRSPLPLGIVVSGNWPLCISRMVAGELDLDRPFRSPRGEEAWVSKYGSLYWVFPNWRLDLRDQADLLRQAGYHLFVHMLEPVPQGIRLKDRPGRWNWDLQLQ